MNIAVMRMTFLTFSQFCDIQYILNFSHKDIFRIKKKNVPTLHISDRNLNLKHSNCVCIFVNVNTYIYVLHPYLSLKCMQVQKMCCLFICLTCVRFHRWVLIETTAVAVASAAAACEEHTRWPVRFLCLSCLFSRPLHRTSASLTHTVVRHSAHLY